ncbi:7760_t:CDS:2, partial [Acaulospora morrowiae]
KMLQSRKEETTGKRTQFRQHDITPRDHAAIEYLLRRGKRQLEAYEGDSVKDIYT